ncbi:MAG: Lrp/AsnC family transcriptional regulator [Paracoccaceae bacterium]
MDNLDQSIIALLSADARLSLATMARRLKIARSTLQARLERLEGTKVIAGYTIKLGEGAREQRLRVTVLVSIEPRAQANIVTKLKVISEIERVITTSGRFDLLLQIGCPTTIVLDRVLDQIIAITGVVQTESLIHLSNKLDRAI